MTAVIPAYRDLNLLQRSVPALLASEGIDLEIVLVNNDPGQDLAGLVRASGWERVRVIEAGRNTGYAGAANLGIRASAAPFVLIANNDLFVTPAFVAQLVCVLDHHPEAGCAGGRLLRYDLAANLPMATIDSAGVCMREGRGAFDRSEGEPDSGQYVTPAELFGVSGAAMLLRRSALDDIECRGEYFDEAMFLYKEDIDLCWRLQLRGWACRYEPAAIAYHGRTSSSLAGRPYAGGARAYLAALRGRPPHAREYSLRNQWLMLVKNERRDTLAPALPAILGRELLSLGANALVSPALTARSLAAFGRALPATLRKRREIQQRTVAPAAALNRWFRE